jgi:hypothetical protein
MLVAYRPARAQDLQRADELVVCGMNDLSERLGFGHIREEPISVEKIRLVKSGRRTPGDL